MTRPSLLFICHFLPDYDGVGPNIRGASQLDALSGLFDVDVLHVEFYSMGVEDDRFVRARAASYVRLPVPTGEVPIDGLVARHWPDRSFVAMHAFRLPSARVGLGLLPQIATARPHLHLDLDDDESLREERTLALMVAGGDPKASQHAAELTRLRILERMLVPRFDTLSLAGDASAVQRRFPHKRVLQLPNVLRVPEASDGMDVRSERDTYDVLFTGSLNYFPNADGIGFFCRDVLPRLRLRVRKPVRVHIVGANPDHRVLALTRIDGVTVEANVPQLGPYYRDIDLCIVPLRTGSGTRVKILEAFSRRRAVVSTTIGAEDLGLTHGVQLLLADGADELADACAEVLSNADLRDQLVAQGFAHFKAHYTVDRLREILVSIYAPATGPRPGTVGTADEVA
jgi:glycosyltransferase involved in cell wall biosynthesis